jgi:putative restriction endonuclease
VSWQILIDQGSRNIIRMGGCSLAFGVFVFRSDASYHDSPAERYQFPHQYLSRVQQCVDDWIIYYEPTKVALPRGYFAVAKVSKIIPDSGSPKMYIAVIEAGSYLDFPNPIPFKYDNDDLNEKGLLNVEGRVSGRAQSAVRSISSADFNRIFDLGFDEETEELPRLDLPNDAHGFFEQQVPFQFEEVQRNRIDYLSSRIVRDKAFRRSVLRAYNSRCAVTGLRLINGGGRAEVQAAHIQPVEANGPDIVSNGLALSGTVHWMFDRGLISASDDLHILMSTRINDIDSVHALINRNGHIMLPTRLSERPDPRFLRWHRENCFKA